MAKIAVALSGGVDSSVAAALLKEEGHELIGFFAKNWSPRSGQSLADCPWEADQADAEAVCRHLGIPFRSCNLEKEYWEEIIVPMLEGYTKYQTPNPDVWCNRYIKFAALWDQAERFGCQYIATGHYAQKRGNLLYAAVDLGKDQSYFLSQLTEDQRERALFPLGGYHKSEVRELATRFGLPTASKKDSQGLCFIGQLDLKSFLREEIGDESGGVFLLDKLKGDVSLDASDESSQQIAVSVPTRYYTIGERVGRLVDNFLYRQVTGETSVPPLYVAFRKGADLYCTPDPHDNVLACYAIEIADLMFLETTTPLSDCFCAVRYHQKECPLVATHEGSLLTFSTPQYAVAPGQLAVFSREDGLIVASGVITRVARGAEMRWDT